MTRHRRSKPRPFINRFARVDFAPEFAGHAREHFGVAQIFWLARLVELRADLQRLNGGVLEERPSDPAVARLVTLIRFAEREVASAEFSASLAKPMEGTANAS